MNDTPKTDTTQKLWKKQIRTPDEIWDFARELERENAKARELLSDVLSGSVDARTYPDGPCLEQWLRADIKAFLANK